MTLPNFIVFGTRKAGTTSLYHYLEQHPQVFMSNLKGTRFFHFDPQRPDRGANLPVRSREEYERYFAKSSGALAIGEASPTYLYDAGAAKRMKGLIPNVRLIASLRNPIDRAYSQYLMDARVEGFGKVNPCMDELLPHLNAGLYTKNLERYYELFKTDQILVLIFEEWIKDINDTLQQTFRFLGVDDSFEPDLTLQYNKGGVPRNQVLNSLLKHRSAFVKLKPFVPPRLRSAVNRLRNSNMAKPPALSTDLRAEIADHFEDDIKALEQLLDRDLSIWRSGASDY